MKILFPLALAALVTGCATTLPAPQWNAVNDTTEAEYAPYLAGGSASLSGQAFLTQTGGGVVKAAGRNVTLDPATTIGNEWWGKSGKIYAQRALSPPSPNFFKARRTAVADAEGKFKFDGLAPGKYYVRTEVTWEVGDYYPTQGGLVGQIVELEAGRAKEVILNQYP